MGEYKDFQSAWHDKKVVMVKNLDNLRFYCRNSIYYIFANSQIN